MITLLAAAAAQPGEDYTALGVAGMVAGLMIVGGSKWLSRWYARYKRAEASEIERMIPERGRDVASAWLRVGAGESVATRRWRRLAFIAGGLVIFFAGLAAALGAWDQPVR